MNGFQIRLKQLRIGAGYKSQGDLAETLGVAQGAVSSWEVGFRVPRPEMLQRLADLFGVSLDYLMGRDIIKAEEVDQLREDLRQSPERQALLKATKKLTPEAVKNITKMIESFPDFD